MAEPSSVSGASGSSWTAPDSRSRPSMAGCFMAIGLEAALTKLRLSRRPTPIGTGLHKRIRDGVIGGPVRVDVGGDDVVQVVALGELAAAPSRAHTIDMRDRR